MSLRKLGRYGIVRVLGKGAMGVVYEGRDPNLERRVAIKTVKVENLSEEAAAEYEARFRTEARSAARLQHPNIVSVYDSDRDGDVAFLVMEYIQGDDLKQHLDKGERYSLEQSLRMIRDLLSALDYAHKQGIVHRDIKPANLLIEPGGRVKLTDFGVARIADSTDATRTQGAMVGTLKYMSPEQVQGQKIDARSDLFSVGVVLYQLLTDKRPFDGENEFTIIQQIAGHMPPPPSSFNARLPAAIDAVVARALSKQRDQRFATARDFAVALQSAMRQAEDATVVPPADPVRAAARMAGVAGASATSPGTSPMGGSTVTQELELVYWKDVKDSTDPEDIQVFLNKFPDGIYAELARRRLRKLAITPGPDQTMLNGMDWLTQPSTPAATVAPASPAVTAAPARATSDSPAPQQADASQSEPGYTTTVAEARPLQAGLAPESSSSSKETDDDPDAVEEATVPVAVPGLARPSEAAPEPVQAAQPAAPEPVLQRVSARPAAAPVNQRVMVFAAVGVLAVIGVAVLAMFDRGRGEPVPSGPLSAASAPAPVASAAASASPAVAALSAPSAPASAPTVTPVVQPTRHAAASPAHPATSGSRRAAAAPKVVAVTPPPPVDLPRPAPEHVPAASEMHPETRVAAGAPRSPASSPADICKDKLFLLKEICLAEQCDKPSARNHPLCVQRRADAKLREESRVRN